MFRDISFIVDLCSAALKSASNISQILHAENIQPNVSSISQVNTGSEALQMRMPDSQNTSREPVSIGKTNAESPALLR